MGSPDDSRVGLSSVTILGCATLAPTQFCDASTFTTALSSNGLIGRANARPDRRSKDGAITSAHVLRLGSGPHEPPCADGVRGALLGSPCTELILGSSGESPCINSLPLRSPELIQPLCFRSPCSRSASPDDQSRPCGAGDSSTRSVGDLDRPPLPRFLVHGVPAASAVCVQAPSTGLSPNSDFRRALSFCSKGT